MGSVARRRTDSINDENPSICACFGRNTNRPVCRFKQASSWPSRKGKICYIAKNDDLSKVYSNHSCAQRFAFQTLGRVCHKHHPLAIEQCSATTHSKSNYGTLPNMYANAYFAIIGARSKASIKARSHNIIAGCNLHVLYLSLTQIADGWTNTTDAKSGVCGQGQTPRDNMNIVHLFRFSFLVCKYEYDSANGFRNELVLCCL